MPKPFKPLLRAAEAVRQRLCDPGRTAVAGWNRAIDALTTDLTELEDFRRGAAEARVRGWHLAAARLEARAAAQFTIVQSSASRLLHERFVATSTCAIPTAGTIFAELRQLQDDFEEVVVDVKAGLITATTERIVMDEIDLGPFRIELHLDLLGSNPGAASFRCVATDPNPASSNESTTHPHVQDEMLCGGEANLPLINAVKQGRLADAFILVRSVLHNYNADSPFVSLTHWSGAKCDDCGYTIDSDSLYHCDGCGNEVCEECYSGCESCDRGRCRSCLDRDSVSGADLCDACRTHCPTCSRVVDSENIDPDTELCPGCQQDLNSKLEQEIQDEDAQSQAARTGDGVAVAGDTSALVPDALSTLNPISHSDAPDQIPPPVLAASAA